MRLDLTWQQQEEGEDVPPAIVNGQRGGNITLYAAITQNRVLHHPANLGLYNTDLILTFLDRLNNIITAENQRDQMQYIVVWDNVAFHRSALTQNWFHQQPQFTVEYLPPYSPFLNPIEEFFSAWWKKVYEVLWPDAPHSSYGGSIHTRVDTSFQKILPILPCT